jgi:hypothetical protein
LDVTDEGRAIAVSFALVGALACSPSPIEEAPGGTVASAVADRVAEAREAWHRLAGTTEWKAAPENPIVRPGGPGEWDEWAVMSMSVVRVGGTFHLYYEGGASGVADLQIGHATSTDGLSWVKNPDNPVLRPGAPGEWDDGATWDPFVLHEDGVFKMWYGGERAGHRDFQCGYAVSTDGTHFERKGRISDFPDGEMADMHVVHDREAGRYFMYYWDRRFEPARRLLRAQSPDETDFDFAGAVPIRIDGEEAGHRYTHVLKLGDTWHMYYGFERKGRMGYATSDDGLSWTARNTDLGGGEDAELLQVEDDLYFMFFCPEGFQDEEGCDIRLALFRGELGRLATAD